MILPISSWSPWTPGPLAEGRLAWAAPGWIRGRLATVVAGGGSCAASPLLRWPSLPFRGSWCWGGCPPPRLVAPVQLGQPFRVPSWSEEPHIGRQCGRVTPPPRHRSGFLWAPPTQDTGRCCPSDVYLEFYRQMLFAELMVFWS